MTILMQIFIYPRLDYACNSLVNEHVHIRDHDELLQS